MKFSIKDFFIFCAVKDKRRWSMSEEKAEEKPNSVTILISVDEKRKVFSSEV